MSSQHYVHLCKLKSEIPKLYSFASDLQSLSDLHWNCSINFVVCSIHYYICSQVLCLLCFWAMFANDCCPAHTLVFTSKPIGKYLFKGFSIKGGYMLELHKTILLCMRYKQFFSFIWKVYWWNYLRIEYDMHRSNEGYCSYRFFTHPQMLMRMLVILHIYLHI